MKKLRKLNLIILFLAVIFMIPVMTKIQNNVGISQFENRALALPPELNKETLFSGEFFNGWEEYLSDNIFARNYWIKSYTFFNMYVLNKEKVNNIVIGKEGTLLPFRSYNTQLNLEYFRGNIRKLTDNMKELDSFISEYGGKFIFIGVPEQSSFLRDKYKSYYKDNEAYVLNNESTMFDELSKKGIDYINMNERFRSSGDENYYLKTDHHFSFRGAYKTYSDLITKLIDDYFLNIRPKLEEKEMDIITLPNPMIGSKNRQLYYLYPTDDKVEIAYPKEMIDYELTINNKKYDDVYFISDDVNERPSYGVYMGGDHAETVIKTNRENLPNLLIFGDSFTNALEPLLYYHFNETRALDLRHYKELSLYEYIDKYKPDVVLMVRDDLTYGGLQGNGNFDGNEE